MSKDRAAPPPAAKLIELRAGELFRLKVPMELPAAPGRPLSFSGSVNSYLVRAAGGRWIIIDPGFYTATGVDAWEQAVRSLRIAPGDVACILTTHYHPDHAGMAGWFGGWTAAPIYMHPQDIRAFAAEWGDRRRNIADTLAQMRDYGVSGAASALIRRQLEERTSFVCPCRGFLPMEDGDLFPVCEGALQVLHVPGHTDGQCALLWPERGFLFSADLLLPVTFSPVGLHCYGETNPVGVFLNTLEHFLRRDLTGLTVLPGHGWPFEDPAGRAAQEAAFYRERVLWYQEQCAQGMDTAWKIARKISREDGGKRYLRSIMWEAMAYLEYLARSGFAVRQFQPDGIHFYTN